MWSPLTRALVSAGKGEEARERAQRALGPRFELRRFHHAVLRNGAVPLTLLDEEIERWRQLAKDTRALAAKESATMQSHFLKVAEHWEALIKEIEAQRKTK